MGDTMRGESPLELATRGATIEDRVSDSFALPMQLEIWLQMTQCSSVLGPLVQVHASLLLSDLRARFAFAEPAAHGGEPGRRTTIESGLLQVGERLTRPQRPARLRVARPAIRFTVTDHAGIALGDRVETLRCVDGARGFRLEFPADVCAVLWFAPRVLPGDREPRVEVSGDLHFPRGVALRIGEPAPDGAFGVARPVQVIELVQPGRSAPLQREELRAALFESPDVQLRFVDAANRVFGAPHRLAHRGAEAHPESQPAPHRASRSEGAAS